MSDSDVERCNSPDAVDVRQPGCDTLACEVLDSSHSICRFVQEACRVAMPSGGDTIYAISISYPGTIVNGLDAALFFSRSTDAGLTWDIVNQQPTGLTSLNFLGFKSDNYAIAAKGSTVAIVAGNSDSDVGLAKSIDGGVTWTYKTIYQFPLPLWNYVTTTSDINNDAIADTISTTDANFAIAVDNNGTVFVAYGAYRLLNDVPSASGYKIFPFTDGLYLWNENMPQNLGGNWRRFGRGKLSSKVLCSCVLVLFLL